LLWGILDTAAGYLLTLGLTLQQVAKVKDIAALDEAFPHWVNFISTLHRLVFKPRRFSDLI